MAQKAVICDWLPVSLNCRPPATAIDPRLIGSLCGGYVHAMRYLVSLLALLVCLGTNGCVTDKKLTPPDSVLDPRGQ